MPDQPITRRDLDEALQKTTGDFDQALQRTAADVDQALQRTAAELKEFSRDLQTEMLKAFATFTEANTLRFRGIEADVSNNRTEQRLWKDVIERRLFEIEKNLMLDPPARPPIT